MEAWDQSKLEKEPRVAQRSAGDGREQVSLKRERQSGNPAFLTGIRRSIEKRAWFKLSNVRVTVGNALRGVPLGEERHGVRSLQNSCRNLLPGNEPGRKTRGDTRPQPET